MTILIDINQVVIANMVIELTRNSAQLDEKFVRHMVLNSIRSYVKQFKSKYGEVVICCDSKKYWRKEYFPFYKSHRKKDREKSTLNWTFIFDTLSKIKDELRENFPYKVIEIEGAEADDIIAVLAARLSPHNEVLILSTDKDFAQLQKYDGVSQYSPILKRFIRTEDPKLFLKEQIMRGDRGDGIPNFLSPDNTFVSGARQKVLNTKKMNDWLRRDPKDFCDTRMLRNYNRNQMLIDLDYVPETIGNRIVNVYENSVPNPKSKLITYLMKYQLKNLMESAEDF